jgi:hypothetical protein
MTLMLPPTPLVEEPVRSVIIPVLPVAEVPVVKERELEIPLTPASPERMLKTPLDLARP